MGELNLFIANFHPVFVHLPIGAYVGLVIAEVLHLSRPAWNLDKTCWFLLWMGVLSTIPVMITGLLLPESDYVSDTYTWHKWLGISVGVLGPLCLISRWRLMLAYRWLLGLLFVALIAGAHNGGQLTHGYGFLSKHAPWNQHDEPQKPEQPNAVETVNPAAVTASTTQANTFMGTESEEILPIPPEAIPEDGSLSFVRDIVPILENHCYRCHGEDKQKAGLRLDSAAAIQQAGVVVPGDPDKSTLYTLTILPPLSPYLMPPSGKPLTAEQTEVIRRWIEEGANYDEMAADKPADMDE